MGTNTSPDEYSCIFIIVARKVNFEINKSEFSKPLPTSPDVEINSRVNLGRKF